MQEGSHGMSSMSSRTRWSDVLNGRKSFKTISRSVRDAHRALILQGTAHGPNMSAQIPSFRYDFLTSGTESWRRRQARMHRTRLERPRLTCCVTVLARVLSVVGFAVALLFHIRDFIARKNGNLYSSHLSYQPVLNIPTLTFCHGATDVPGFSLFDQRGSDQGPPLYTVRGVFRSEAGGNMTEELYSPSPFVLSDGEAEACVRKLSRIDASGIIGSGDAISSTRAGGCRLCFQFGGAKPLQLRDPGNEDFVPSKSATKFRVHFEASKILFECRKYAKAGVMHQFEADFVLREVFRRRNELAERGVLKFNELDMDDFGAFLNSVPVPGPIRKPDSARVSSWELGCHLYLLSGTWYPTTDEADISYSYNDSIKGFQRSGKGPWLTAEPFTYSSFGKTNSDWASYPDFAEIPSVEPMGDLLQLYATPSTQSPSSLRKSTPKFAVQNEVFGGSEVQVLDSSIPLTTLLPKDSYTSIEFSLFKNRNVSQYELVSSSVTLGDVDSPETMNAWIVDLSIPSFNVKVIQSVVPSTARFLSDFFEYLFFFVGLSVFSSIVAPINLFVFGMHESRRRAREAEAEAASPLSDLSEMQRAAAALGGIGRR